MRHLHGSIVIRIRLHVSWSRAAECCVTSIKRRSTDTSASDLASNQPEGYAHLERRKPGDVPTGSRRCLDHRPLARSPADQSILWDFLDSYIVGIEEDRWRILGDVVQN